MKWCAWNMNMGRRRRDVAFLKWPRHQGCKKNVPWNHGFLLPVSPVLPDALGDIAMWLPLLWAEVLCTTSERKWCRLLVLCAPLRPSLKISRLTDGASIRLDPGVSSWVTFALESHWGPPWIFQEWDNQLMWWVMKSWGSFLPWYQLVLSQIKNVSGLDLSQVRDNLHADQQTLWGEKLF